MRAALVRGRLVTMLLAVVALGWWTTVERMRGMDAGPWTGLGSLGWFVGLWIVMMAAMMLPTVIPTVAVYDDLRNDRTLLAPLLFLAGYLAIWVGAGLVAYTVAAAGDRIADDALAWNEAGRWAAGVTLLLAAVYELTPLKDACLARCRSPIAFMLGSWRPGRSGGLRMGATHGAWCAGCCWALMVSLFALGVMSIAWTALVAGLVALEKIFPWRRVATWGTAALLISLSLLILLAPGLVPALQLPGGGGMSMSG